MNAKRFMWSCFMACIVMGCGESKKQKPQDILMKWSNVCEGMTNEEISKLLGTSKKTLFQDGETVNFYSSGLSEADFRGKGLLPSMLIVFMTNSVVKEKNIMYR